MWKFGSMYFLTRKWLDSEKISGIYKGAVDLVIPNKYAVEKTQWHNWFNNEKFTRVLINHGLFPNTIDNQKLVLKK